MSRTQKCSECISQRVCQVLLEQLNDLAVNGGGSVGEWLSAAD